MSCIAAIHISTGIAVSFVAIWFVNLSMMQLFGFAQADPRLRWPKIMLVVEGEDKPCVRAALAGPKEIAAALAAFGTDPVSRAAVLLGARGGLRLSDMEALRIGDVEKRLSNTRKVSECLTVVPVSPDGVLGMGLCWSAARMVLALIAAREAQELG